MIGFRSSATASVDGDFGIDLPVPSGVQSGDFMLAQVTYRQGSASLVTIPAGWTEVRRDASLADSGGVQSVICRRVATGSEPASYRFTFGDFRKASGGIVAYTGVKTAQPIDVHDAATSTSTTTPTTPSISTVYTAPWLIWVLAARDNGSSDTATVPSGMSQRWRVNSSAPGCVSLLAEQVFSGPGSSGTKAGAVSPAAVTVAQVLFLNPADESPNHPPTANAGPDKATEVGVGVVFDGSGSDSDPGDDLTYAWTHLSGPNGTAQLSNAASATPTFTPIAAGVDTFRLTVTDESSATASDDMSVSTTPAGVHLSTASGSGATMPVSLPPGAVAGDVAFFALLTRPFSQPAQLADWTAIQSAATGSSSTNVALWVFGRRLTAGDISTGTFTASVSDVFGSEWSAVIVTIRNVRTGQLANKQNATTPLGSPSSFGNTVVGPAGSATYTYTFTAFDAAGETIPLVPLSTQTITNAPNTLTALNYVKLLWQPVARATGYKVYGRTGGSQQLIATVTIPQDEVPDEYYFIYKDVGGTPGSETPPTQQPIGWLMDGLNLDGGGTPRPERLFTTYTNAQLLVFAAGQLPVGNASATVADPGGVTPLVTKISPNNKMILHAAIQTIATASTIGTRLFTPSDYTADWTCVALLVRPSTANGTPTAIAGFDQQAEAGTLVYLDASQSFDQDGDPLAFNWTQTAGPTVSLSGPTTMHPTFTMPGTAVTFSLRVTDPDGLFATDTVTISPIAAGRMKIKDGGGWTSI